MGKAKNEVVPYRDSALTRILQSALGGNSKTIMICALSPSFMNYEETLGTLRYADRAKKIKNVAVINESQQDKIIRELKVENKKLKEMLSKIVASGGTEINLAELGITNMAEVLADMNENDNILEDLEKPFELKLAEKKEADALKHIEMVDTKDDDALLSSDEESKDDLLTSTTPQKKGQDDSLFQISMDAKQEA